MNKQLFDDSTSDSGGWITTFADLMTLLLVFFILMFSMSSVQAERFEQVMASIQISLQSLGSPISMGGGADLNSLIEHPYTKPKQTTELGLQPSDLPSKQIQTQPATNQGGTQWQKLANTLRSQLIAKSLDEQVRVSLPKDGMIAIQVQGAILFDSGSTFLNFEADPVLDTLLDLFHQYQDYSINIKGHTDNIPISTDRYESNWELSAIRATTVLRYFVSRGVNPRRFTATGFGDSLPLGPNNTDIERSRNRRIEFVLERQESLIVR